MLTLSYGYKKPQTGDKGSVYFPALEGDIQQLNDHTHNGTDSAPIPGSNITNAIAAVGSADWALQTPGTYRALVNLPLGYTYDGSHKEVRISGGPTDGAVINPTIEKIDDSSLYLYVNDNSLNLNVSFK